MAIIVVVALFIAFVSAVQIPVRSSDQVVNELLFPAHLPVVNERVVSYINTQRGLNWRASLDQGKMSQLLEKDVKSYLGYQRGGVKLPEIEFTTQVAAPDSFDARKQWPQCTSIGQVRDQSACGSCWAFGAVEAMTDRWCITKKTNYTFSADDLLSCCTSCGMGCNGGFPPSAWSWWVSAGIVSEECAPYPFPSCDHHVPNSTHPCPSQEYPTPPCKHQCVDSETYTESKKFGGKAYSCSGEAKMLQEIMTNGPVEAAFEVYADFLTYKSGVYHHTKGSLLGGHAIKILGWGLENNEKYWLVANS